MSLQNSISANADTGGVESLDSLVRQISTLVHSRLDAPGIVERTGALLVEYFRATTASIRLWHGDDRYLASFDHEMPCTSSDDSDEDSSCALFLSRPISVRGATYGRLQLEYPACDEHANDAEPLVGLAVSLLAQLAEMESLRWSNNQLRGEVRDLGWQLRTEKLLVRATGMIGASRGMTSRQAMAWLREQSNRLGLPLWQTAERLLDGAELSRRIGEPASRGEGLRRTA